MPFKPKKFFPHARRHHFFRRRFPLVGGPWWGYQPYYVERQVQPPARIWYYASDQGEGKPNIRPEPTEWVEILVYNQASNPAFGVLYRDYDPIAKVNIVDWGHDKFGNKQVLAQRVR